MSKETKKSSLIDVFAEYHKRYEDILKHIYPAKNSTGFPERNLSVNFSKAYEKIACVNGQEAFSWFEFQFGIRNNLHVDAVIINNSASELLIVESKRYSNPSTKIPEVGRDIDRIYDLIDELKKEKDKRINISEIKSIYGVILADVWKENSVKKDIFKEYEDGCFLLRHKEEMSNIHAVVGENYEAYSVKSCTNYNLVSFCWKV